MRNTPKQQLGFDFLPLATESLTLNEYKNITWKEVQNLIHHELLKTTTIDLSITHSNLMDSFRQQESLVSGLCSTPLLDTMQVPCFVLHVLLAAVSNKDITIDVKIAGKHLNNIKKTINLKANIPAYVFKETHTNKAYLLPSPTYHIVNLSYDKKNHKDVQIHLLGFRIHNQAEKHTHKLQIPNVFVYDSGICYEPDDIPITVGLYGSPYKAGDYFNYPEIDPLPSIAPIK